MPVNMSEIKALVSKAQERFNNDIALNEAKENIKNSFLVLAQHEKKLETESFEKYENYINKKNNYLRSRILGLENDEINEEQLRQNFPDLYSIEGANEDLSNIIQDIYLDENEVYSLLKQAYGSYLHNKSLKIAVNSAIDQYHYFMCVFLTENFTNDIKEIAFAEELYEQAWNTFWPQLNQNPELSFSVCYEEIFKETLKAKNVEIEDDQKQYNQREVVENYSNAPSNPSAHFILQAFSNPVVRILCGLLLVGGLAAFVVGTCGMGGIVIGGVIGTKALIAATTGTAALVLGSITSTIGFFADKMVNQERQDYHNDEKYFDDQEQQYVNEMHQSDKEKNDQDHDDLNGWQNNYQQ